MDSSSLEVQLEPKGPWLDFADDTCDMTVKISAQKFDCHKCLMLRRCRFFRSRYGSVQKPRHMYIDMDGFPGGVKIFCTIRNFCYGVKINLVADTNLFYLSHAAIILGMSKSDMSEPDNLQEFCDKFWQEHMLNSWRSVFQTMNLLQEASKHLPKCQIDVYMQKCMEALCSLIKDIQGRDLDDFMQKLLLLPECQLGVIASGLKSEWSKCQRTQIITSLVLAATAAPLRARVFDLVAKSLLLGNFHCINAPEQEKEVGAGQLTSSEEQVYLSIPNHTPTRVCMLILIDSLPLKDEPVAKLRRNIFKGLFPYHFFTLNPRLVLKLITNFVEDEYKLLRFDHTGSDLLFQYLESLKLRNPIPFSLFLEFAKALSVALRNSHDRLYDEIKLYYEEVSLSKVEKQKLEHFVNCAKLSGDRLKEVIASDFSCALGDVVLALGDVVLALRKENEELKEKLEKKRPRDYSDSSLLEDQTPSKIPRTLEDDEVENDLSNSCNGSQLLGSDDESDLQLVYTDEEEAEDEDEECLDMVPPSDLSQAFYISVMTTDYMCLSFSVNVLDTVALLRRKILEEMEMNSLSIPIVWYLMYKGKKVVENETLHANAIEMYGEIQMQGCSAKVQSYDSVRKIRIRQNSPGCAGLTMVPEGDWFCLQCRLSTSSRRFSRCLPTRLGRAALDDRLRGQCRQVVKAEEANLGGCVLCRSGDFTRSGFGAWTIMLCDQCEREFHVGCLKEHGLADLEKLPEEEWFCGKQCSHIRNVLKLLVLGGEQPLPGSIAAEVLERAQLRNPDGHDPNDLNFSWQILHGKQADDDCSMMLSQVLRIFSERFGPIVDGLSGQDLIPLMVQSRSIRDQEFGGMYCIVLKRNNIVVSAAVLRIFGQQLSEMPLVATSKDCEGLGYCQALLQCIDRVLGMLHVQKIALPAADGAEAIWVNKFGYTKMPSEELSRLRKELQLMIFLDSSVLEKDIVPLPGFWRTSEILSKLYSRMRG